jgi:hypothetical protein
MKKYLLFIVIVIIAVSVYSDTITLIGDTILTGDITGYDRNVVYIKLPEGQLLTVRKTSILSIESVGLPVDDILSNKSKYPRDYSDYNPLLLQAKAKKTYSEGKETLIINKMLYADKDTLNYHESYLRGWEDARMNHKGKWFDGAFASSIFFGAASTMAITLCASKTEPSLIPPNCNPEAYLRGYGNKAQKINRSNAIVGGVCGTVTNAVLLLILANNVK